MIRSRILGALGLSLLSAGLSVRPIRADDYPAPRLLERTKPSKAQREHERRNKLKERDANKRHRRV